MRCENCNAKLGDFADSIKDGNLEKCPICGAKVSAHDTAEPGPDDIGDRTNGTVAPQEDPAGDGECPESGEELETYEPVCEIEAKEREPEGDMSAEEGKPAPAFEEDVSDLKLEGEPEPNYDTARTLTADAKPQEPEAVLQNTRPDAPPSFFSILFAMWLIFTGLATLSGAAASFFGEFILTGDPSLTLPGIYFTGIGLLLVFGAIAALSLPGALRAGRAVLSPAMAASGILALLYVLGWQLGGPTGEIAPGLPGVFALLAIAVSLLAVFGYGWALRTLAITALSLLVAGLVCGPFPGYLPAVVVEAGTGLRAGYQGLPQFAPVALLLVAAFGTALHFTWIRLDTEKKVSESIFTWMWPIFLAGALLYSVLHIAYSEENGALQLFRSLTAISAVAGGASLFLAAIAGGWQTGNDFRSDLRAAADGSWGWAVGFGALIPLLWFFAGHDGSRPGTIIVAVCAALLFWIGWISGKRSEEQRIWLSRWEAATFLFAAFLFVARRPLFYAALPSYPGGGAFVLFPHVAWSVSITALILVGTGKLAMSCRYNKKDLFENTTPACRVGVAACLCALAASVAYISGGSGLREAFSRILADAAGFLNELLLATPGAGSGWLEGGGAVLAVFRVFSGVSPVAVIALALTGAGIYWAAGKKIRPAACLAGLSTFAVTLTMGFMVVLFTPYMFLSGEVSASSSRSFLWISAGHGMPPLWLIVVYGILMYATVRFTLLLPAFFKSHDRQGQKGRWDGSYDRMMAFGMILWAALLFLSGMVVFNWIGSAVFFQLRGSVAAGVVFLSPFLQVLTEGWQGYGYVLLISFLIILAIHTESVRGERGAFAGLALIWTVAISGLWLLLFECAKNMLFDMSHTSAPTKLMVALTLLAGLLTVKVLGAWALSFSSGTDLQEREGLVAFRTSGVATLGRIGSALVVFAALACIVWLLLWQAGGDRLPEAREGLLALRYRTSNLIGAMSGGWRGVGAPGFFRRFFWFAALVLPILFYIGQFSRRSTGRGAAFVFSLSLLCGFIALGMILGAGSPGAFSPAGAWLLGGYCAMLVAALGTLAGGWAGILSEEK